MRAVAGPVVSGYDIPQTYKELLRPLEVGDGRIFRGSARDLRAVRAAVSRIGLEWGQVFRTKQIDNETIIVIRSR